MGARNRESVDYNATNSLKACRNFLHVPVLYWRNFRHVIDNHGPAGASTLFALGSVHIICKLAWLSPGAASDWPQLHPGIGVAQMSRPGDASVERFPEIDRLK